MCCIAAESLLAELYLTSLLLSIYFAEPELVATTDEGRINKGEGGAHAGGGIFGVENACSAFFCSIMLPRVVVSDSPFLSHRAMQKSMTAATRMHSLMHQV